MAELGQKWTVEATVSCFRSSLGSRRLDEHWLRSLGAEADIRGNAMEQLSLVPLSGRYLHPLVLRAAAVGVRTHIRGRHEIPPLKASVEMRDIAEARL